MNNLVGFSSNIDEAKLSSSTFIYHKPSGKLYLNSNGVEAGWSDNNADLPFLELIGSPELSADNIKVIVDDHEYRIPSTSDNSGSTIPYSMYADEYQARHLWESSGRDNVIKYFIDKNGAYGNHRAMPKKGFKYIRSALRLIDKNTSIDFKKNSMEWANLVLGAVSKYKHAHYKRKEWGGSAA